MFSLFSYELEQRLLSDYNTRMPYFSYAKAQVDAYLEQLDDREHRLSLVYMYAYMPESDIISYSPSLIDSFVISSLKARKLIPYTANVSPIDFLTYVMHYRINNENIEEYRESFFQELYPRIKGLSITQAALEVNYWCFEKATYCATDGRTASPLTTIRRTRGRCGEESTLCAAALRSVGIPARQVYVPWWAHTESNHAWVEIQIEDGTWQFLGACEPEPVLNKGWFTVPGSRSMNMVARAYTKLLSGDNILEVSPISQFINCTSHYAPVTRLTIYVTENGKPASGLSVALKISNWHHLVPLYHGVTDQQGMFSMETGLGSLMVHVSDNTRMIERLIDTKDCTYLEIVFDEAVDMNGVLEEKTEYITMTPPPAIPDKDYGITQEMQLAHETRMKESEAIRFAYEATFQTRETFIASHKHRLSSADIETIRNTKRDYMAESRGNFEVLEQFLLTSEFTMEEKLLLLDSMQEKDMVDANLPTLIHTLETTLPYRNQYPEEVFKRDLLSPRIAFAMIEDNRLPLKHFLEKHNIPADGMAIWKFLKDYVSIVPKEASGSRHLGSPLGALKNRICSKQTFGLVFVSLCRAAGIPARMERREKGFSYYTNGTFVCPEIENNIQVVKNFAVTLRYPNNQPLRFFRDFLLEKYNDGDFEFAPIFPWDMEKPETLQLPEGYYRIVRMNRDEDGTANLVFHSFPVHGNCEVTVPPLEKILTIEWLNHKPGDGIITKLSPADVSQPIGFLEVLSQNNCCSVWMVLNPGKEPTEHILNEMLSHQDEFNDVNCRFFILLTDANELANPTLQKALKKIPVLTVYLSDAQLLEQIYTAEPSHDIRLPFVAFLDSQGVIRYTWTGYRIGTAQQILEILDNFSKNSL